MFKNISTIKHWLVMYFFFLLFKEYCNILLCIVFNLMNLGWFIIVINFIILWWRKSSTTRKPPPYIHEDRETHRWVLLYWSHKNKHSTWNQLIREHYFPTIQTLNVGYLPQTLYTLLLFTMVEASWGMQCSNTVLQTGPLKLLVVNTRFPVFIKQK